MKKIIITLSMMSLLAWVVVTSGCKKYGFNIPDGYSTDSTAGLVPDSSKWGKNNFLEYAGVFPGLVSKEEPRTREAIVTLNLDYEKRGNRDRVPGITGDKNVFSTGMYAPAGEPVTIVVPQGVTGLICQIGIWSNTVNNGPRYPKVYSVTQLFPGTNVVQNQFGGNIYISPVFPVKEAVTLSFSGACESPDFNFGNTNGTVWKQKIAESTVPWFEIATGKIIFTLPTKRVRAYLQNNPAFDPDAFCRNWNETFQLDFEQIIGLFENSAVQVNRPSPFPWRVVFDAQLNFFGAGYPVTVANLDQWVDKIMAINDKSPEGLTKTWDLLSLYGKEYIESSWVWPAFYSFGQHLFPFWRAKRLGIDIDRRVFNPVGFSNPDSFALEYVKKPPLDFQTGKLKDFDADNLLNNPYRRMIMMLQIFDKLKSADGLQDGFGFMAYIYEKKRENPLLNFINDTERHDFFYESLCEYVGLNCLLFLQAWGINTSAQKQAEIADKFPVKLTKNVWQYNPFTRMGGDSTVVTLPGQILSRDQWTIIASSEETVGENAPATKAIDGNINTFWHSKWQGSPVPFPHFLLIDMHEDRLITSIALVLRQNQTGSRPRHFKAFVGDATDESAMTLGFEGDLENVNNGQLFNLSAPITGRYIKIIFTDGQSGNNTFATIAEVYAM